MKSSIQNVKNFSKPQPLKKSDMKSIFFSSFIVKKFLAHLTKNGKQIKAEKLLKSVFLKLFLKRFLPIPTLVLAVNNVKPFIEVRSVRVKGRAFQVPFPIKLSRQVSLSIKQILKSAFSGKDIESRLAEELINSSLGKSASVKSTINLHKIAFQNRLSTNYRWF